MKSIPFIRWYDVGEKVVVCKKCECHICKADDIISKEFQGQYGRAYLYNEVSNVWEEPPHTRRMTTGEHTVSDIHCIKCDKKIGWKYLNAKESSQRYKEGHYVIERSFMAPLKWSSQSSSLGKQIKRRIFSTTTSQEGEISKENMNSIKNGIYYTGFLLITGLIAYYKPNTSPKKWAEQVALERLKEKGIDPEKYEFYY